MFVPMNILAVILKNLLVVYGNAVFFKTSVTGTIPGIGRSLVTEVEQVCIFKRKEGALGVTMCVRRTVDRILILFGTNLGAAT